MTVVRLSAFFGAVLLGFGLCLAQYPSSYYPTTTLPLYAGGIAQAQPPTAAPQGDQPPAWAAKLQEDVSWIRKTLEDELNPKDGADAEPPPATTGRAAPGKSGADALNAALGGCAACHAPGTADRAGGGHVLFEKAGRGLNYLVPDDPDDWDKAVRLVRTNRMPKTDGKVHADPLTADQKAAYLAMMQENKPTRK